MPHRSTGDPVRAEGLRFRLLGPLRGSRDGADLDLGPKQQRLVLALLLARAGTWVSTPELVELLWGENPPPSAANTVHRYVGALRRMIEPGLAPRAIGRWLLGETGHYRMDVDADALDLLAFRREIETSRREAATGARAEALQRAAAALEQWRDRPAAGLDEWLTGHPVFEALEDECTQSVRWAAQVALTEERPGAVLPAVRRSAARHPMNEALHGLLMSLLAADGRTTEAVRAYQDIRRRLVDELGVEPGADLETALSGVLRRTGAEVEVTAPVGGAPGAAPSGPTVRPAQLPADHAFFAGRRLELRALTDYARQASTSLPIIGIDGIPGVGKTTLAVHLAHRIAGDYPDGNLYLNLRGFDGRRAPVHPAEALQAFLSALGVAAPGGGADVDTLSALFRSTLAERRVLIVLDNADDAAQVRPLLPGGPHCLVIVTSRTRLSVLGVTSGAHLLTLDVPEVAEAREAIRAGLAQGGGPSEVDDEALDEIIERCGRLPFALSLMAARMRDTPVPAILAELRAKRHGLDVFADANLDNDLRAVFACSYDRLTPEAATLFRALSVHPGPDITEEAMAAVLGVAETTVRPLLRELMRTRLLTRHRPRRYQMHVLVALYAAELAAADPRDDVEAARLRLVEFCGNQIEQARDVIERAGPDAAIETGDSPDAWFEMVSHDDDTAPRVSRNASERLARAGHS